VSGWSLVQRSPTECGVSECNRETSKMKRPWPTRGCCAMEKIIYTHRSYTYVQYIHRYVYIYTYTCTVELGYNVMTGAEYFVLL
jgi:hypothetical protein